MTQTKFTVDKEKLQVKMVRNFKATPQRMWQAFTDPQDIVKWWDNTTIDKNDVKVGGVWRYISKGQDGNEYAFNGVFKELEEPTKIVRTFEFELRPGHVMTESVVFEAQSDGTTTMTNVSQFVNLEDLNGMVNSGMERGAAAGIERIAKLVEAK